MVPNFTLIGPGVGVYSPKNWKNSNFTNIIGPKERVPCAIFAKFISFMRVLSLHHCVKFDPGGPGHHFKSQTFFAPIHSFAARGHQKFGWNRPHRSKLLIILLFIEIKQPNLTEWCRLRTRIKLINFAKIPLDRSRWNLPNFTLIAATCRPCEAKNPKIGPWVNEIPAELSFGQILPVKTIIPKCSNLVKGSWNILEVTWCWVWKAKGQGYRVTGFMIGVLVSWLPMLIDF